MSRKNKIWLLFFVTVLVTITVFSLNPIPQSQSYHAFCDNRSIFGIRSFANVFSNISFLVVGLIGLLKIDKSTAPRKIKFIYGIVFTGIFLTAFGSGYYHYFPNNNTLVYDRMPMTIVFMGITAAVLAEGLGPQIGILALVPLLMIGSVSIIWWHFTELQGQGDLRLYILVQYYPIILIPLVLLVFPNAGTRNGWPPLLFCFGWYAVAKIAEGLDCKIYTTLNVISGHTIKHFAAAVATGYLVRRFKLIYVDRLK